jgi:hypothetical protein
MSIAQKMTNTANSCEAIQECVNEMRSSLAAMALHFVTIDGEQTASVDAQCDGSRNGRPRQLFNYALSELAANLEAIEMEIAGIDGLLDFEGTADEA